MRRWKLSTAVAVLLCCALPGPASAATFTSVRDVDLPASSGPARDYPDLIGVVGLSGSVQDVNVHVEDLSHPFPGDVDLLLVGPQGQTAMLMSDVGSGNPASNIDLTFDDDAAGSLSGGTLSSGTYKPTDLDEPGSDDVFPSPAPPAPYGSLGSLGGSANGTWSLYAVDDKTGDVGSIGAAGARWSLTIDTSGSPAQTFSSSTGRRDLPASNGPAGEYPWTITTFGLQGVVTEAQAVLHGLGHEQPDQLDVMLTAPDFRRTLLTSDAGGTQDVNALQLRFGDAAPAPVPATGPLASGSYKPTDLVDSDDDSFPSLALAGPFDSRLSALTGANPNGAWGLWVVDDASGARGELTGWTLQVLTSGTTQLSSRSYRVPEGARVPVTLVRSGGDGTARIRVAHAGGTLDSSEISGLPTTVNFNPGETSKTILVRVSNDRTRERNEETTLVLSSPDGAGAVGTRGTAAFEVVDDDGRPAISRVSIRPKSFKARLRGPSVVKRRGAVVRYRLTRSANLRVRVQRRGPFGGWKRMRGSFEHSGLPGRNRFRFSGRLRNKQLEPGRYRLVMVARDGQGRRSLPKRVTFTIKRP